MKEQPKFFVLYKDFNDGQIHKYDVLDSVFERILTPKGEISRKKFIHIYKINNEYKYSLISTKEELQELIEGVLMNRYWSRCEWEFIAVDWPYKDDGLIESARPVKVDAYDFLKPNLPVITDLVWNYLEPKIKKLQK